MTAAAAAAILRGAKREDGSKRFRSWYLSREEIERGSPSLRDGVDAAKEAELRTNYSSFICYVCVRLRLPQVTYATAVVLCHRFYLRQSHARNEWQTVATACVFLASKIEDTPCLLKNVVLVAYQTMYHINTDAAKRIHQKEVLEKQKALILVAETLLLSTIRFDFNIQHPYEPLKLFLNKLGISHKEVRQVAMSLIDDTLPTTLAVQFEPHCIAAGSLFLASKLHNVILPSQNCNFWWNEFHVAPKQLQAVIQQMNVLFKKRYPCSIGPVIKPVPTSTLTDKHQIKPTPTLSPTLTNKQQIKQTPTLTPTNKQHIKQTPTPTPWNKQQVKQTPTLMDKQKIKAIAAPTRIDKQHIIRTLDPALRHTQSSRSFGNNNSRDVPLGSSFDNKPTSRSGRHGDNWDRRLEEQSCWETLKAGRVNEAGIRDLKKRRIQEAARFPGPVRTPHTNAWKFGRQVSYVETNSSWKKQKVERR